MKLFIIKKIANLEYKVNLPMLWLCVFSLLFISIYGLALNDWSLENKPYMVCNSQPKCFNTMFNSPSCENSKISDTPICKMEYIPYGFEYGSKPDFLVKNSTNLTVAIVGLFLFFNTFLFNKQFLKDFKVNS